MLFNSIHFLLFLLLVIPVYFLMRTGWPRKAFLLASSYYFYMVFSIPLALLLAGATVVNFVFARFIEKSSSRSVRKTLLAACLASDLGTLFFFKYFNFFAYSLSTVCGLDGSSWVLHHLILPMGISFYIFQSISYVVDVWRGDCRATRSLLDMALYVSFFPQLVAGPIMRGTDLMPQFAEHHEPNLARIQAGLGLCLWGLLKKSMIADPMGRLATTVFGADRAIWDVGRATNDIRDFSSWAILMATWAFAIQIYCDFSAYTDIARGAGRMLGFRLMNNFDRPYLATSMREFWRRWHISLSTWLRDYLYIPLGGNRKGPVRTYVNLLITMILGGLWHGASWTYVAWGGIHGALLAVERALGLAKPAGQKTPGPIVRCACWLVTFHLICLTWIFFRATSIADAAAAISGIVSFRSGREIGSLPAVVLLAILGFELAVPHLKTRKVFTTWPVPVRWAYYPVLLLLIILYAGSPATDFLYFQF